MAVGSIGDGEGEELAAGSVDAGAGSGGEQADRRLSSIRVEQIDGFNQLLPISQILGSGRVSG